MLYKRDKIGRFAAKTVGRIKQTATGDSTASQNDKKPDPTTDIHSKPKNVRKLSDNELAAYIKRHERETSYNKLTKVPSDLEKTKSSVDAAISAINQTKNQVKKKDTKVVYEKMDLKDIDDAQLRAEIKRFELERDYTAIFGKPQVSKMEKGRAALEKTLELAGTALAVGSSALAIAVAVQELKRK